MIKPATPEMFFATLFDSKAARDGAVIRRKVRDVERLVGRGPFLHELSRRGFTVVENAGQFVVFCKPPVRCLSRANSDAEFALENDAFSTFRG